jgi:hypothetical protein
MKPIPAHRKYERRTRTIRVPIPKGWEAEFPVRGHVNYGEHRLIPVVRATVNGNNLELTVHYRKPRKAGK